MPKDSTPAFRQRLECADDKRCFGTFQGFVGVGIPHLEFLDVIGDYVFRSGIVPRKGFTRNDSQKISTEELVGAEPAAKRVENPEESLGNNIFRFRRNIRMPIGNGQRQLLMAFK